MSLRANGDSSLYYPILRNGLKLSAKRPLRSLILDQNGTVATSCKAEPEVSVLDEDVGQYER